MVRKVKNLWVCEACGFKYESKEIAQKCEDWCKKHKSCNMKFTKYAVQA